MVVYCGYILSDVICKYEFFEQFESKECQFDRQVCIVQVEVGWCRELWYYFFVVEDWVCDQVWEVGNEEFIVIKVIFFNFVLVCIYQKSDLSEGVER